MRGQETRYRIQDTGSRILDSGFIQHLASCILFLLASCILHPASCQVYPVQSTLQITPPYSLTLADYVAPASEKMALNIFLADVNRPELSVRLRLRIEGVGIRIETKAEYLPEPMSINGGVPLRLIGADLVSYFDPRNLNFSGITQREYEQKGALPEGLYQFTFEVLEYNRGVKISNSATVMAWLILNDPPLINLPRDQEKVRIQSPQQVIFQWTPRHTGSPNAAFTTEYEFQLVEVWPATRNPNDAILTSPVIFETTTSASTLIYGPAETALEPGRKYAFRIKAKSIAGVDELNLFKNNGYSQVGTFVYGDACTLPTGIQADLISSGKVHFVWDTQDNHTGYSVKYRLANTPDAAWYTNTSSFNEIEINSLKASTAYEYQVAADCGSLQSTYSPVAVVTTKEAQAITYSCGLPLNPFDLDPSQLIESLKPGDIIQAGDFEVKLKEVSGSNGVFTGKGVIEVPFFNKATLQASFSGISVNKELRMVAGSMNITGGGVEVIPAGVMDVMDQLTEVLALADSALNLIESNLPQPFDPYSFVADKEVKVAGTITSVSKDADGSIVVTTSNGAQQTVPSAGTTAITDSSGNGYLIDSKGKIHPTTAAIASAAAHREYNLNVNFAKATDTKFGFDAKKYDALVNSYELVKDKYYVSWKSIATGQTDNVLVLLEGTNVDKSKIRFEQSGIGLGTLDLANTSQSPSPNSQSPNTQVLSIKGIADGMQESVVALYTPPDTTKKEQVLGKLNVVTYNQIDKHVVIVPVNGNTFSKFGAVSILQDSLNKIYNQGIVNWTVELKEGITVEGISPFEDGGTGLLSNFTGHMKEVINAYKDNTSPDTYYLFLVSNPQDPTTLGVMPRSKEYGFIFADKHSTLAEVARTIAHELGHGAFNLHHTFMEPNYTITKGTTDNLMDYPAGPKLYKYQWDKIRYPDIVVGVFESDEEGELGVQVVQCISSAAIDMAMNYAFKWVEINFLDENPSNNYSILDFKNIWASSNKWEVFSSATLACATAVIPFPSDKAKLVGVMTASFGAGAVALVADAGEQYEKMPVDSSFLYKIQKVDWENSFKKAGIQAFIAGVSTGVILYSVDHPRFRNFAAKLKNLSYDGVEAILKKSGFSDETIEAFCKRFGLQKRWFNFSSLRNATVKTPGVDNSSLTNLPSSFWDDAYKVTPSPNTSIKSKVDNIVSNGDLGGDLTEDIVNDIMVSNNYKIGDGKYYGDGNNGIDGFYYKGSLDSPTEIIVIESKQMSANGSVSLNNANPSTGLPSQMRDLWLEYIANNKLLNLGGEKMQVANAIINAQPGSILKYVVAVDKSTGQINFLRLGIF